nr:unnamed protein product [Callosobruchus chinensis]
MLKVEKKKIKRNMGLSYVSSRNKKVPRKDAWQGKGQLQPCTAKQQESGRLEETHTVYPPVNQNFYLNIFKRAECTTDASDIEQNDVECVDGESNVEQENKKEEQQSQLTYQDFDRATSIFEGKDFIPLDAGLLAIQEAFSASVRKPGSIRKTVPYWWTEHIHNKRNDCIKARRKLTRATKRLNPSELHHYKEHYHKLKKKLRSAI